MRTKELFAWIKERHKIYIKKQHGMPKPWTQDVILQNYRFCNVYRELDTVTEWIATNWREPHADDEYLWFALMVARFFNRPDTLHIIGYPVPFHVDKMKHNIRLIKRHGDKVFSGAYIVSTIGRRMPKDDYLFKHVFTPAWDKRKQVTAQLSSAVSLRDACRTLGSLYGMGGNSGDRLGFMAAQVIADLKYVQMRKAPDWETFAASGPGSRRGLNRVHNYPVDQSWQEDIWHDRLLVLRSQITPLVRKANMPPLHAQDLQNCLCEFDKYQRTLLGEGRPRSTYQGGA